MLNGDFGVDDFYQLRPVPNMLYGDFGEDLLLVLSYVGACIHHQKIILETVSIYDSLQKNNKFVMCIVTQGLSNLSDCYLTLLLKFYGVRIHQPLF